MGRLIDADAFYKRYCETYEDGVDEGEIDRMAYIISTEPTAYDTEKVVEKLEVLLDLVSGTHMFAVRQAIAIVKKGGAV